MALNIVILAAGFGTRMNSNLPKVLHCLAGKPLLAHVVEAVEALEAEKIHVVYHHEIVREQLSDLPVHWVEQNEVLGTGHALKMVLPHLNDEDEVLVICGDTPLISAEMLNHFLDATPEGAVGCLTAIIKYPKGFGRIIRGAHGALKAIIEEKDATSQQRKIREVNTGIYIFPVKELQRWLPDLNNDNAQSEYYLTDLIAYAVDEEVDIVATSTHRVMEVQGINDNEQLSRLERYWQRNNARQYMRDGLTLIDPERFDVRGALHFGKDVIIDANVLIEGDVTVGDNCHIGPNVVLRDTIIGNDVTIKANSVVEESKIADSCTIGPFARIRPQTDLAKGVKIGNFVEIKKSTVDEETKISHLSYIGDSDIGKRVNIGAGTITCNYDGKNKHKTTIGDDAFIGSDTQLIAPVTVGAKATIGAGSTITQPAPEGKLTLSRAKQTTVENWERK